MSFAFHHDKPRYFNDQYENAKQFVVPFIEKSLAIRPGMKVMEIGCAEGGVLKAFTDKQCLCVGVELSPSKVENAHKFMKAEVESGLITFVNKNIYDIDFQADYKHYFDLIVLKDTIEHIPEQEKIISYLKLLLKPQGHIFFGFPPWQMPWGGHQQICKSKFLMFLPYFHLLPMPLYKAMLKIFGETPTKLVELQEIKETGISTLRFERIIKDCAYDTVDRQLYLVNPIYKFKFGWKPRKQSKLISSIPVLRDFLSTTAYYLIKV